MVRRNGLLVCSVFLALSACGAEQSSFEGRVSDEKGRPLAGVTVVAFQYQPMKGYDKISTMTDSSGAFVLTGLYPNWNYQLGIGHSAWKSDVRRDIRTAPSGQTGLLEGSIVVSNVRDRNGVLIDPVSLTKFSSAITGWIHDDQAIPIKGMSVHGKLRNTQIGPGYDSTAVTDEDGKFILTGLFPESDYQIELNTKWTTNFIPKRVTTPKNGGSFSLPRDVRLVANDSEGGPVDLHTNTPRFRKLAGNIVEDGRTGLQWLRAPMSNVWASAVARWIRALRSLGDVGANWRFPTQEEIRSIVVPTVNHNFTSSTDDDVSWRVCAAISGENVFFAISGKEMTIISATGDQSINFGNGIFDAHGLAVRTQARSGSQPETCKDVDEQAAFLSPDRNALPEFSIMGRDDFQEQSMWTVGEMAIIKNSTNLYDLWGGNENSGVITALTNGQEVICIGRGGYESNPRQYVITSTSMGGWVPERDLEKSSKQTAGTNTKGAKDTPTTKDTSANDNTDSAKPTREPDEVQTTGNASSSAETLKPKNAVVIEGDIQQSTQLTNRGMPTTENVKGIAAEPDSRCYELRIYYAAPEKLDALKARFRDHTCTLFEKHDLANVGYWTPLENPDNKLVYILSSPSREAHDKAWKEFAADPEWKKVVQETEANGKLVTKVDSVFLKATDFSPAIAPSGTQTPRCFELRTYTAAPGKMDALLARFRDHTLALFTKHGMTHIGYWTRTDEGPSQLIYILAHQSKDAAAKSFESFRADPAWIEAKKASETNGSLTEKVESVFMTPVDFSPIK